MTQCVICMEEVKEKNCATLNCNHTFHATCLMQNVAKSNNCCPLCREEYMEKPDQIPNLNNTMIRHFVHNSIIDYVHSENQTDFDISFSSRYDVYRHMMEMFVKYGTRLGTDISEWIREGNSRLELSESTNLRFSADLDSYIQNNINDDQTSLSEVFETSEQDDEQELVGDLEELLHENNLSPFSERILRDSYLSDFDNFLSSDIETIMYPPMRQVDSPLFSREEANTIMGGILQYFSEFLDETQ